MMIDIDVGHAELVILVNRGDGTATVSVSAEAFERAAQLYAVAPTTLIRTTHQAERAD